MARAPFEIAGVQVPPGTRRLVEVPVARLYTHTPLHIPVEVVHGRRDGPVLMVCGAIHGDEINGVEIVRRVLTNSALRYLRGTLLAVPSSMFSVSFSGPLLAGPAGPEPLFPRQ